MQASVELSNGSAIMANACPAHRQRSRVGYGLRIADGREKENGIAGIKRKRPPQESALSTDGIIGRFHLECTHPWYTKHGVHRRSF